MKTDMQRISLECIKQFWLTFWNLFQLMVIMIENNVIETKTTHDWQRIIIE